MLSLYDLLKARKTGIAPDLWTALAAKNCSGDSGAEVKELTGIPPLSIRSNGTMLLDYLISGNMVQTGTPTPQNPIQPQECGERTGNLYFKKLAGANISDSGVVTTLTDFDLYIAEVEQGVRYSGTGYIYAFFEDVPTIGSISFNGSRVVNSLNNIVSPINGFIAVRNPNTSRNAMLNLGSTVLPYEPYGYKLPITSTGQTNNIYLGEVPTTRKIKKLVMTGKETYTLQSINSNGIANFFIRIPTRSTNSVMTHFKKQTSLIADTTDEGYLVALPADSPNAALYLRINSTTASTVNELRTWLAEQNANGTPVTVWYVLKNPETVIVNEPLRKIGDYADTISMEQAQVQIPTNRGLTTIDVATTLKPSQAYIKYKG